MQTITEPETQLAPTSSELLDPCFNTSPTSGKVSQTDNEEDFSQETKPLVQPAPTRQEETAVATVNKNPGKQLAPTKKGLWGRVVTISTRLVMTLAAVFTGLILVLAVGPRFLPYQICAVLTGSMEPTLPVGSIVILSKTDGTQLQVGDIITFNHPLHADQLVTHRIFQVKQGPNGPAFVTKGDANNTPDSWIVNGSGVGWREVISIPYLGYLLGFMGSPLIRLLFLGIPALILGFMLLVEIWSPQKPAVAGA